jgi:PKD repeat protein
MHRLATRLRTHLHDRTRGQSLVEFALVLPIMLLLTLTALDFGRVYLGYINLQNMARIAANSAANHPGAWDASAGDPAAKAAAKAAYQNEILGDAVASNCDLPKVAGVQTAPAPTFTDANANGLYEIGDTARVNITCQFHVITPVISNIVGGSVSVSASSVYPVSSGMTSSGAGAGAGIPPSASFTGNTVVAPSTLSGTTPFTVVFRDTSGGGTATTWSWDFNDPTSANPTSNLRDPLGHTFNLAGSYVVSMTAQNAYGSSTEYMTITVTNATTVDFNADRQSVTAGTTVTFTDASSPGTSYAWTFGAGEGTATGVGPVTHRYNTAGTYAVSLTVTYASGPVLLNRPAYITVSAANCVVPLFNGVHRNNAAATWSGAGFTGTVSDGPNPPNGNYVITSQSIQATLLYPCNSNIQVNRQ